MRFYQFKIGNVPCICFEESSKNISIVDEFTQDKHDEVLSAYLEHGAKNSQVEIGFNYLYIEQEGYKILIDTGLGKGALLSCMEQIGLKANDIDVIIITHGDGDHVGGLHQFKRAKIIMAEKAYALWMDEEQRNALQKNAFNALKRVFPIESIRGSNSGKERFATVVLPSLGERLQLVKDGEEFIRGLSMFPSPGHREDHYCLRIESAGSTLICLADALRHGFQMKYSKLPSMYDSVDELWTQSLQSIQAMDPGKSFLYFANHVSFPGVLEYNKEGLLLNKKV